MSGAINPMCHADYGTDEFAVPVNADVSMAAYDQPPIQLSHENQRNLGACLQIPWKMPNLVPVFGA